ncbi:MAG: hypothetical protein CBC49_009915 [Alphaproteobacteria bacterium TMED89]|nr:MAG: hypothetical protein CBC49_009915 [Alphaproteobacteria bacterium TMED89]
MIVSNYWTRRVRLVSSSALLSVGLLAYAFTAGAQRGINLSAPAPNVEQAAPDGGRDIPNGIPFQISVDGVPIDASLGTAEDDQRAVDVALDRMDVHLTFDGLKLDKAANIQANKAGAKVGEEVVFTPYWNYGAFIERAEVRIFGSDDSTDGEPLKIIQLPAGRSVGWEIPEGVPDELKYVLRLYSKDNRFDETRAHRLKVFAEDHGQEDNPPVQQAGYGRSSLAMSNIALGGGTVTVFGENVPADSTVYVLGLPVPVDSDGKFVTEQVLPAGSHNVTIAVLDNNKRGLEFQRNLHIPDSDFFYVALGDLTVGSSAVSGPTELVGDDGGLGSNFCTNARLAGFLKGKVRGDIYVTAQADTGEASVQDIFTNLLDKDASSLIERIDDDRPTRPLVTTHQLPMKRHPRESSIPRWKRATATSFGVTFQPELPEPTSHRSIVLCTVRSSSSGPSKPTPRAMPTCPLMPLARNRARFATAMISAVQATRSTSCRIRI